MDNTNSSAAGASNGAWDEDGEGGEASNGHSANGKYSVSFYLATRLNTAVYLSLYDT